jgi:hypothetical protein
MHNIKFPIIEFFFNVSCNAPSYTAVNNFFRVFSPAFLRRYLKVHHNHAAEVFIVINIVLVDFVLILCSILIKLATVNPLVREVSEEPSYSASCTSVCVCVCVCVKLNETIRNN